MKLRKANFNANKLVNCGEYCSLFILKQVIDKKLEKARSPYPLFINFASTMYTNREVEINGKQTENNTIKRKQKNSNTK